CWRCLAAGRRRRACGRASGCRWTSRRLRGDAVRIGLTPAGVSTGTSTGTMGGGGSPFVGGLSQPHAMAVLLFGKRPAPLADRRRHSRPAKALRKLKHLKGQIGELAGMGEEREEDGGVDLAEGNNASIGRDGRMRFGWELL